MARTIEPEDKTEEDLAVAIKKISAAMEALAYSGLNRKAIVALVHDHSKVAKKTIITVLESLEILEHIYCTTKD